MTGQHHHWSEMGHIVLALVDKIREADRDTSIAKQSAEREAGRLSRQLREGICLSCATNTPPGELHEAEVTLAREEGRIAGSAQAANEQTEARIRAERRADRAEYAARAALGALTERQRAKLWPSPVHAEELHLSGGYTTVGSIADELLKPTEQKAIP